MTRATVVSPLSSGPVPPDGPVSSVAKRVIELLRVGKDDLVVDLSCRDPQSPFSQRLAFLLVTSGVRMVQMGASTFGRLPMQCERVVLRDGSTQRKASLRRVLAVVLRQLDPAGRVLIAHSAPSPDAPLFAEGLRRWNRRHRSSDVVAELMREAGFFVQVETVECLRRVSPANCYAWVEFRDWPILKHLGEAELQRGLCELRARYGSRHMVEFTSRFDVVLGTKPEALAS